MSDNVDKMIDYIYHDKPKEKDLVKRIRVLVIKMEKVCTEDGDFNVILNSIELLKEYYTKLLEVYKEKKDE